MRHLFPLVTMLSLATPALAQTIDEPGAAQLRESLSRYVGQTAFDKGVLHITLPRPPASRPQSRRIEIRTA